MLSVRAPRPPSTHVGDPVAALHRLASAIRAGLGAGSTAVYPVRDVIQSADDFAGLADDVSRWAFLAEPSSTSDPRYDALLAGLTVHV